MKKAEFEKINGYTKEEAEKLIKFVAAGKKEGKPLSYLFELYGMEHGRAKGSVRNYYYGLLKCRSDERVVKLLDGSDLTVERVRSFTPEETDEVLRSILQEKARGMSVRKAISALCKGDEKLGLRMQNKYRNLLKKEPERVKKLAEEYGVKPILPMPERGDKTVVQHRLEEEIDALCKRLTASLEEENRLLKAEIEQLKLRIKE